MPSNAIEEKLLETLEGYLDAVKRSRDPGVDLKSYFDRLEMLSKSLPPGTQPQLRHYLQQKSYRKAHDFLRGGDPEAGSCGR
jgi:hypothetical protein